MVDLGKMIKRNRLPRWEDFLDVTLKGEGGFGKVYKCIEATTGRELAIKELNKNQLISSGAEKDAMNEIRIMKRLDSIWIIKLHSSWQDPLCLYFVMDYMPNGDMWDLLGKFGYFPLELVRHYTGELALALQYLQDMNVVNRDIKPTNILLDFWWHTKLCDFGFAQSLANRKNYSRGAIVTGEMMHGHGTKAYIAPEVFREGPVSYGPDRWAFGCIVFEMHTGLQAFPTQPIQTFVDRITKCRHVAYPSTTSHPDVVDFCNKIFQKNPEYRLGAKGIEELKAHPFVRSLDWDNLHELHPPIPFFSKPRKVYRKRFLKANEAPPNLDGPDWDKFSVPSGSFGASLERAAQTPPLPVDIPEDLPEDDMPEEQERAPPARPGYLEPEEYSGCLDGCFGGQIGNLK